MIQSNANPPSAAELTSLPAVLRQSAKTARNATGLRKAVADLLSSGVSKDSMLLNLRVIRSEFREAGDEWMEDVITDTAAFVPSWTPGGH